MRPFLVALCFMGIEHGSQRQDGCPYTFGRKSIGKEGLQTR
jgi:hypothetical protein